MPSYTFTENTSSQNSSDTPTSGVEDMRMRSVSPTTNFNDSSLEASKFSVGNTQHSLLRFDTSSIPAGETVTSATMYLWMISNDGTSRNLDVYEILQNGWVETQATWNDYSTGNAWNTAGCQGSGTDRAASADSSTSYTITTSEYKSFSVSTSLINKSGNTELMIELGVAGGSGEYSVWRSSNGDNNQRPELVVITTTGSGADSSFVFNKKRLYNNLLVR